MVDYIRRFFEVAVEFEKFSFETPRHWGYQVTLRCPAIHRKRTAIHYLQSPDRRVQIEGEFAADPCDMSTMIFLKSLQIDRQQIYVHSLPSDDALLLESKLCTVFKPLFDTLDEAKAEKKRRDATLTNMEREKLRRLIASL